ncbi:hypothetical protein [Ureaplasma ceti]|uniref:Uncharacterized protein n=1 Tax=Ureaplasma ceti TaxID=3119530 RepID=A0ABP9U8D5_9BACT
MALLKKDVQNTCLGLINEWLDKSKTKGLVLYRNWIDGDNATIHYEGQPLNVKCELCLFVNIDDKVYHIFINFKVNQFKYELNARKKALLVEKKNGLMNYDVDAKHAFRVVQKDKQAIFLFVANEIAADQVNSWKSRVLCCYPDTLIPTLKKVISDMKANSKNH